MKGLQGKNIILTGATGGLGTALAYEFIQRGAKIMAFDISSERLTQWKEELRKQNPNAEIQCFTADVRDWASMEQHYKAIESSGNVDWVFHNAGIANIEPFLEESSDGFQRVMDINFNCIVPSTRYWLPKLKQRGGKIINMASVAGHCAPTGLASYAASKFALVGFTRSIQMELLAERKKGRPQVDMVLVCPGFVATNIMQIGQPGGFPKEYQFLVSTPKECASTICKALMANETEIYPTINGKAILFFQRFLPDAMKQLNIFFAKKFDKKGNK